MRRFTRDDIRLTWTAGVKGERTRRRDRKESGKSASRLSGESQSLAAGILSLFHASRNGLQRHVVPRLRDCHNAGTVGRLCHAWPRGASRALERQSLRPPARAAPGPGVVLVEAIASNRATRGLGATPRNSPEAGSIHSFLPLAFCANKTPKLRGKISTESARSSRLSLSTVTTGSWSS